MLHWGLPELHAFVQAITQSNLGFEVVDMAALQPLHYSGRNDYHLSDAFPGQ